MRSIWTRSIAITLLGAGVWLQRATVPQALAHDEDHEEPQVFNLSFAGGSMGEFAAALRRVAPGANLVVMPPAEQFRVPAMELVAVDVEATLGAMDDQMQSINGVTHDIQITSGHGNADDARPVYMILARPHGRDQATGVWSLSEALSVGAKPEDIVTAVQAALSFAGEQAEIKYHPETRLLMARASEDTINVIEQVIERTQEGFQTQREREEDDTLQRMSSEMDVLHEELDRLREENLELRRQLADRAR